MIAPLPLLRQYGVKQNALAKALGITPPALHKWDKFPAERVPDIEAFTGIPRHVLRPDLWTPPQKSIRRT